MERSLYRSVCKSSKKEVQEFFKQDGVFVAPEPGSERPPCSANITAHYTVLIWPSKYTIPLILSNQGHFTFWHLENVVSQERTRDAVKPPRWSWSGNANWKRLFNCELWVISLRFWAVYWRVLKALRINTTFQKERPDGQRQWTCWSWSQSLNCSLQAHGPWEDQAKRWTHRHKTKPHRWTSSLDATLLRLRDESEPSRRGFTRRWVDLWNREMPHVLATENACERDTRPCRLARGLMPS